MAAALVGVAGNEVVAQYRLCIGRRIGSAALEADGLHARTDGVVGVGDFRIRWVGHQLHAEIRLVVDRGLSVVAAHDIAERSYHELLHRLPRLSDAIVHTDPSDQDGSDPHGETKHHRMRA
ncbi:MAG: cation transporter dimerization domain-containing protein [Acidimicrobiales bacterium]